MNLIESLEAAAESPTATHASLMEQAAACIQRLEMTLALVVAETLEEVSILVQETLDEHGDPLATERALRAINTLKDGE